MVSGRDWRAAPRGFISLLADALRSSAGRGANFLQVCATAYRFPACWQACAVLLLLCLGASDLRAADSDLERWYISFRGRDTDKVTDTRDLWGASIGKNFNKFVGAEIALDTYEVGLRTPGDISLGNYSVLPVMGELRLRYPMFNDRFTPYAIAGAGPAFTQFNDQSIQSAGRRVQVDSATLAGVVGGGVEFYVADNIAIGAEARYLYTGRQDVSVDGRTFDFDPSRWMATVSMRVLAPENDPKPFVHSRASVPSSFYVGPRFGMARAVPAELTNGVKLDREPSSFGPFNQYYGLAIGTDIGARWSVELSVEAYESRINVASVGSIGEYGVYPILAQVRYRFPLDGGRWVPYVMAGAGATIGEYNDRSEAARLLSVDMDGVEPTWTVGGGVERFVTSNVSFHVEAKYLRSHGHDMTIGSRNFTTDIGSFAMTLGFRARLFDF